MDERAVRSWIVEAFDGVHVLEAYGDTFFVHDPHRDLPPERQLPFATIVNNDNYETVSNLARDGVYRLNIGLTRATYRSLFGKPPTERDAAGVLDTGHDPTALDTLMPHPVYASQHWVSILVPDTTWPRAQELLAEARAFAVRKHGKVRTEFDTVEPDD